MNEKILHYDNLRNLIIGTVEFISPKEIKVVLDIEAPQNTALNTGVPTLFPKINGYVLIPNESGALVGMISWIGIEPSRYPKRKGFKDFDLIDLPFPLRKMSVSPLGILKNNEKGYEIERGVYNFPSVGDPVIIPTQEQLQAIVENKSANAKVKIGYSPLAANTPVFVDPDKLFGRHTAVLGNTGSGKSCSVAGLIRWSLEAAKKDKKENINNPNARFIIIDPNGEYTNTFDCDEQKIATVRKFRVKFGGDNDDYKQLRVPIWMWNSYEWCSITQASSKVQNPLLRQALRAIRNNLSETIENINNEIKIFIGRLLISIRTEESNGNPWGSFPRPKNFTKKIEKWQESIQYFIAKIPESESKLKLEELNSVIEEKVIQRSVQYPIYDFSKIEVDEIRNKLDETYIAFGGSELDLMPISEDAPVIFQSDTFLNYLDLLSNEKEASQYMEYYIMRIKTMLADTRMSSVIGTEEEITLIYWLENYIGKENAENGEITIIDLSLVPPDILHVVISVISRIIFEALQRYRRKTNSLLPTVIVMEEAHNFISRYKEDSEDLSSSRLCTQVFERISKEGRKFGLGLMLSSQRPSELSPTVLSQCNTFLLHRLVNDKDQELVKKFVPDNLGSILNELPVLPTKKAILLGWAAPIPVLVEMNELKKEHRPDSKDPDFWKVWIGEEERKIDWKIITDEWQGKSISNNEIEEDELDSRNNDNEN